MPAPGCPPGVRTYSYQNQDAPRSGAHPAAPRPAHNSVRAGSAISSRPTPPAPTGRAKKLLGSFSASVAPSGADSAYRSSTADCGKTRSAAYRCSQTRPLTPELPRVYVVCVMKPSVLRSSGNFNTDLLPGTGVLLRRLPRTADTCPIAA